MAAEAQRRGKTPSTNIQIAEKLQSASSKNPTQIASLGVGIRNLEVELALSRGLAPRTSAFAERRAELITP